MDMKRQTVLPKLSLENLIFCFPGHLYWKDIHGVYLGCNDAQAKSMGLNSPHDIIGKTDFDLPHQDVPDLVKKNDNQVIQTKIPMTYEEGGYLSRKAPLYDDQGNVIGMLGIAIDIQDYKKSIQKKQLLLEEIIAKMPGHVYWKGVDRRLLGCNDQQAKDTGLKSREEVVGKTAYDLLWQDQPEENKRKQAEITDKIDEEIMLTNQPRIIEETVVNPDLSESTYLSHKVPLHDEEGGVVGLAGISFDISDRKHSEFELKQAKESAEKANNAKTEFLFNMRHDFRTPFSGIIGMSELMEMNEDDPEKRENLACIKQAAQILLDQLNEIFDFIHLEDGHLPLIEKKFNLHELLFDMDQVMFPVAKSKHLSFNIEIQDGVPMQLLGDKIRTDRILVNLVSNALKFTKKGSVSVIVSAPRIQDRNVVICFTVKDTGIGIPHDQQLNIFEKFNRLSSAYSGQYTGKGLGLNIIKRFVHDLNGEIELDSESGKGTSFSVLIPYRTPLLADAVK